VTKTTMPQARSQRFVLAFLTLALFTMTQCVCQNRQGDDGKPGDKTVKVDPAKGGDAGGTTAAKPVELPKSVDYKDLDDAEKKLLGSIMSEQFDPCGSPKSLLDVLKSGSPCDRAFSAANKLVEWVGKGLSKRQVVQQYLKELARTSVKAEFSFEGSPAFGDPASKIVMVKFTDFECPYCKMSSGPSKELAKKYGAVLYVKHMPLGHHKFAKEAAMMSLAAHKQGKFWEVYKAFFDNQEALSSAKLRELVKATGLDMARFDTDLKSAEIPALLKRDREEADAAKVDGTPTFYINGYKVEFDNLEDKLKELSQ